MLTSLSNEVWGLINSKTFQHPIFSHPVVWWCHCCHSNLSCHQENLSAPRTHPRCLSFPVSFFYLNSVSLFFFFFCDQELVFYFQLFTVIFFSHHCGRNGLCSSSVSWKSRIKSALASFLLRVKTLIHCVPTIVISLTLQMIVVNITMTGLTRDEKRLVDTVRS